MPSMNELLRPPKANPKPHVADSLERHKWSLAEFERLSDLGFFGGIDRERDRVELIDGELIPMHSKGGRHEWVRGRLLRALMNALPDGLTAYSEPGWRPGGERYLEPEMIVCDANLKPSHVPPSDVLLLIEVADTSLKYDEGVKAVIYASVGVREYWVIDANSLRTRVHLKPSAKGYHTKKIISARQKLVPTLVPGISLSLGSLGID